MFESLEETVLAKNLGDDGASHSEEVCEYPYSQEFLDRYQKLYLRRYMGISDSLRGESVDLTDSYRRLIEKGLVENDPG